MSGRKSRDRAALYARVSTNEQDVELQLRELREYVARRGWTIVGEYADQGVSGAVTTRPALTRLMEAARRRQFDILLVWKFDRFARSTRHLLLTLDECRHLGIHFVSLTEQIDTGSPLGEVVFVILGALAQFERDLIRERVHAGLRKARADGKRLGRPPASVNRSRIADLQRQGLSYREIGQRVGLPKATVYKYRDRTATTAVTARSSTLALLAPQAASAEGSAIQVEDCVRQRTGQSSYVSESRRRGMTAGRAPRRRRRGLRTRGGSA